MIHILLFNIAIIYKITVIMVYINTIVYNTNGYNLINKIL